MRLGKVRYIILAFFCFVVIVVNGQTDRQFVREGNYMFSGKQYDKAELLYRKAVSKNPSNPQAVYNLGCALMMQNKDSAAIVQYQKAINLEKNKLRLASVYHNIGVISQNHKLYGDAIKAYEQALRNNPKDEETRYNLALCKKLLKKDKQKGGNKNEKDKNKGNNDKQKDKDKNKDKEKENNKQQQQHEQMSRENAEQLINAAIQNEKATQQRLKKAMQKTGPRRSGGKNW